MADEPGNPASSPYNLAADVARFEIEGGGSVQLTIDPKTETVWATLLQIAELFGRNKVTILGHIKNIFDEKELDPYSVVRKFLTTAADGKAYETAHYNLDMILSVGYRVSSARATQFRQWANSVLKSYLMNGYVLNEGRLKDDPDSLKKLAARVRALRAGERSTFESCVSASRSARSITTPKARPADHSTPSCRTSSLRNHVNACVRLDYEPGGSQQA